MVMWDLGGEKGKVERGRMGEKREERKRSPEQTFLLWQKLKKPKVLALKFLRNP